MASRLFFSSLNIPNCLYRQNAAPGVRGLFVKISIPVVTYRQVKELYNHPKKLLIDVRTPEEVMLGKIPLSINIPVNKIKTEMDLSSNNIEKFQKKYQRTKPNENTYIIVYCRDGTRAELAGERLVAMGYKNVHNYIGSWRDYVRHNSLRMRVNPCPKESYQFPLAAANKITEPS